MKIICIVGARPNFMKIAPIMEEMKEYPEINPLLVHTGQHYDHHMSNLFFKELNIPEPDVNLEVGPASHAVQTAMIMQRFEKILLQDNPELVIVVGDVNSTIACALTSAKLNVPVAHVEAGLRSFDRTMPEEINRLLTDTISDYLFASEGSAVKNLLQEGIGKEKIYFVGNVMIDTLRKHQVKADKSNILSEKGLKSNSYGLVTLHRPSNVDDKDTLEGILSAFDSISKEIPIIFPCHPRTQNKIREFNLDNYVRDNGGIKAAGGINLCEPLGYLDFLHLMSKARMVFTDSGGIQEETTILGIPCITLRENTERPVTITHGTNIVIGNDKNSIKRRASEVLSGESEEGRIPELWDGKAAGRIVSIIAKEFGLVNI